MSEMYNMLKKIGVAISLHRYELAIKLSKKVLSIDPNISFAYYYMSLANVYLGKLDEAEKLVKLVLFDEPISQYGLSLYCIILFLKGQYQFTIDIANEVLKINPQNENAIYFKAYALYNLGDYKKAEYYFKQVLAISPTSNLSHIKLANIYSETNRKKIAEQEYLEALKLAPNDAYSLNCYGKYLLKQNCYSKKGLECLKSSLKNEPNNEDVILYYEAYSTIQNLLFIFLKSYKEIFEFFFSKRDIFLIFILSIILYFLGCPEYKITLIFLPFYILYIISCIIGKYVN